MPTQVSAPVDRRPPLRAVREARGLSLRETARRAGMDISHLSRIERGQARVSVDALARLAKVLGLTELERHLALYTTPESAKPAVAGSKASRDPIRHAQTT